MNATPFVPHPAAKQALIASFAATMLLGGTFILTHWIRMGPAIQVAARAVCFAGAMVAVHIAGYRLYRRQPIAWSRAYGDAIRLAGWIQVLLLFLSSLILDGGVLSRVCMAASAGVWVGTAIIICRRPESPTRDDLFFIRWGFFALCPVALILMMNLPRIGGI